MAVRVSPISRVSSMLIIVIGALVLIAGLTTGTLAYDVAGIAFIILGVALYGLLIRFTMKLRREITEATSN